MLNFVLNEGDVIIKVEDTGPGFSPDVSAHLFEPFFTHGKSHGTGLGLSICKRIVEDHKGWISASSKRGGGAILTFSLPRSLSSPRAVFDRRGRKERARAAKQKKVSGDW